MSDTIYAVPKTPAETSDGEFGGLDEEEAEFSSSLILRTLNSFITQGKAKNIVQMPSADI